MNIKPLQKIGRYEILCEIAQGGMATVYYAYDPAFGRYVAIKILPRTSARDEEARARFEREIRIVASLEHPAIVPVYDYGEDEGYHYLVMRFLKGGSLRHRIQNRIFSLAEAAELFAILAPAVDKVHQLGVVHRDLKPDNILFDEDDNPYIADFGIARFTEGNGFVSADGMLGTLSYASPEHIIKGKGPTYLSDIYALGVILYEVLTGEAPYKGEVTMQVIRAILSAPVPNASSLNLNLPVVIDALLARAMAKNPLHRYQSGTELADALQYMCQTLEYQRPGETELPFSPLLPVQSVPSNSTEPFLTEGRSAFHRLISENKIFRKLRVSTPMGVWLVIAGLLTVTISAVNASNVILPYPQGTRTLTASLTSFEENHSTTAAQKIHSHTKTPTPSAIVSHKFTDTQLPSKTKEPSYMSPHLPSPTLTNAAGVSQPPAPTVVLSSPPTPFPTHTSTPNGHDSESSPGHSSTRQTSTPTPTPTRDKSRPTSPPPTIAPP